MPDINREDMTVFYDIPADLTAQWAGTVVLEPL
jgi:hypothetical protein